MSASRHLSDADILAAIRRWHDRYGEPPTMLDWDPYRARKAGQSWRIERYEQGAWPSVKTVRNRFGRLSDAVALAGLVPRFQGQQRPRQSLALDESVLLHVAMLGARHDALDPSQRLAHAVHDVATARAEGHHDLRLRLIELAACSLAWARNLTGANRDQPMILASPKPASSATPRSKRSGEN